MSRSLESRPRGSGKQRTKITFAARARILNTFKNNIMGHRDSFRQLILSCRKPMREKRVFRHMKHITSRVYVYKLMVQTAKITELCSDRKRLNRKVLQGSKIKIPVIVCLLKGYQNNAHLPRFFWLIQSSQHLQL